MDIKYLSKYISGTALALFSMAVNAQNISTEVVVDRNIVPQERAATRPGWLVPQLELPEVSPTLLDAATYTGVVAIDRDYIALRPAEGAFAAVKTPYRGYFAGGYFPTVDFGVSAGYRIISKENMSLGARLQFDKERYRPYKDMKDDKSRQNFIDGTAGIDFSWRASDRSVLSAFGQYSFLREKSIYWEPQTVNSGAAGASWQSSTSKIKYHIGVRGYFEKSSDSHSYMEGGSTLIEGIAQQQIAFDGSVALPFGKSSIGLDVNGDYVHTDLDMEATKGYVDLTPHYAYQNDIFSAKIGVRLDIANKVRVMPDVRVQWIAASMASVWTNVTGGSRTNSFERLRQLSVYQVFETPYSLSRIPVEVNGGINLGPFRGVYFGVFGGYAIAYEWLMLDYLALSPYEVVDVRGWHCGAKIGAEWRFIKAEVSADFAPSSYDRAWYTRRDRAATVVDTSVELNPVEPLTVAVNYQFRNRRKAYSPYRDDYYVDLGCVSDLSVGAEWRFTPSFAVFARVENILGRQYKKIASDISRKQSGLIGLSVKF